MAKLWQKNWQLDDFIETFETGDDLGCDQKLIDFDVYGSIAHARGLVKIGILKELEYKKLKRGLAGILALNAKGKFNLRPGDEDIHTKIENYLTSKYGEVGKKIHTGRSADFSQRSEYPRQFRDSNFRSSGRGGKKREY